MVGLAPLAALALTSTPGPGPVGNGGDREEPPELAELFPEDTLLYVESRGFSQLCEQGLEHPFVQALLSTKLGEALRSQADPEDALALLDFMAGMPVLESLGRLTTRGMALGVAGEKPEPETVLVLRAASEPVADELREQAFEVLEEKTGHQGALEHPHERPGGARLWHLGEALVVQRGATILLGNSRDYVLRVDALARADHERSLLTRENFRQSYEQRSDDGFVWAYADRDGIERAFDTQLDELAQSNGHPGVHALLGAPIGALATAGVVTAELTLDGNALELELDGHDTDATMELFPRDDLARPAALGSKDELASALFYRDFGSILRDGRELFQPRMVPRLAEAESQLALFFSGQEVGSEVLPHVSPWIRLVSRPLAFERGPTPELPLPGLALVARLEQPEEIGPQFLAAFQSIVSVIGVDQAQKQGRPFLLAVDMEDGIPLSYARFLDPLEGDGVDMRYNLRPACAVYEDTLILGTHEELVRTLLRERAGGLATSSEADTGEWLRLAGEPLGRLIRANFEAMVMDKVLEDGVTREKAEEEIGGLELVVTSIRDLAIELPSPTREHVRLSLRLTLDDDPPADGSSGR